MSYSGTFSASGRTDVVIACEVAARVEKRSCPGGCGCDELNAVAEASEYSDHFARPRILRGLADRRPARLVPNALVENLRNEPTGPMSDRANRLRVSEARDETGDSPPRDIAFGFDRGVRRLIEDASHLAVGLDDPRTSHYPYTDKAGR